MPRGSSVMIAHAPWGPRNWYCSTVAFLKVQASATGHLRLRKRRYEEAPALAAAVGGIREGVDAAPAPPPADVWRPRLRRVGLRAPFRPIEMEGPALRAPPPKDDGGLEHGARARWPEPQLVGP